MFSHSCYVGWYTPVLPLLVSENTPLPSGPLSLQEMSWIGSLFSISAAFGSLIAGFFIVRFGVKRLMVALSFAAIVSRLFSDEFFILNYLKSFDAFRYRGFW